MVVMGVSGSGKTTVGRTLAARLGVPFLDSDDLHPQANVDKMAAGHPLDDRDRAPWLEAVGHWLGEHPGAVVACSALARRYRDTLREHAPDVRFLQLDGRAELFRRRLANRSGHFMPASLLDSQLAALEPLGLDEEGLIVDAAEPVAALVARYVVTYPTEGPTRDGS